MPSTASTPVDPSAVPASTQDDAYRTAVGRCWALLAVKGPVTRAELTAALQGTSAPR